MLERSPMLWGLLKQKRIDEDWALQLFAGSRLRLNQEDSRMPGPKQMWECSDGSLHPTEGEFNAHEAALQAEQKVDQFVASTEFARGGATRAKNIIMQFKAWESTQGV